MNYFKFRPRSAVVHIVDGTQQQLQALCGKKPPERALLFERLPNGRICAMCGNRRAER